MPLPHEPVGSRKTSETRPGRREEVTRRETPADPGAELRPPAPKRRGRAKPKPEAAPATPGVVGGAEAVAHVEDRAPQLTPDTARQASETLPDGDPTELELLIRELRDTISQLRAAPDLRSHTDLALAAVAQQQQAMVVRLHQAARRAQSVEVLRHMIVQFLRETHVRVVTSIEDTAFFPGVGAEGKWEVVEPAYVDGHTGRLVQPGTAARADDVKTDDEETQ
ncbi:hypothetical protein [Cellulomonas flavigena]|uniref:hypothetical protein n=1 Tax=Cellulomonas flavigena TaxID=1711 RepID=UPI0011D1D232|nr:hypothetical protein [Cellulomonas flavigena]